ncbi:ABC transporter substrate-binding protein [Ketogulonicigenium vulgare]|uniref:Extracellular solute-binding protein, family 1 n=2 Tax=Ketogulonicigenium vulgare TaxID=92945 RepID=F9Y7U9_KETVW|nr:extracellular solute-binding protein [Ketogulonicigenium vulgare]ADO41676.1 extracellular solute-binding protein [Ketogulonicigenium vulgare Y25]AEM39915.1 Extracellular solute-binding protein, family 1 [Ketogulonicigenium vulgare WSH-001]ALJ80131.1 ABC transporter substrate-binding protein [Ketogulonicigenium vulgare]ANW32999.1 ABC transporter substrate-binding protein [Ketogulonicigenium vulgare]
MTMTKKVMGASALSILVAGAAWAEGPVSWWYETATPAQQDVVARNIVQPFQAANAGTTLNIEYRGAGLDNQIRIALLSGSGPDIVYTGGPSYVAPMARAGQLLALDSYAETYGWNDSILPVFLEMGRYDGALYALPKTYETLGLYYNKTLFETHGWQVPTTLEDLETVADAMLAEGIIPFASGNALWRPTNEHYVTIALNAVAGPENVYKALTGEIPWTAEPFVAAITRLNDWWQKGYFGPNYFSISGEQQVSMLAAGQAGMMPSGTWQFQHIPTYFPQNNAEAGFVGFPSAADVGEPVFPLGVGSTFSIASASRNPDGAAAVIDFIFSEDTYEAMNAEWQGEWNMPLSDLSGVELPPDVLPLYTTAMQNLAQSVSEDEYGYTTWTFLPPATVTYLVSGIEEVWVGQQTVEQFLTQLDTTFRQERDEGKVPATPAR